MISPFLSVVPLTSIVVEPSTPPAFSCSPLAAAATTSTASSSDAETILVTESDDEEPPPETSISIDRLYFPDDPWFTLT